jgi:hypothetical protein
MARAKADELFDVRLQALWLRACLEVRLRNDRRGEANGDDAGE